MENLEEILYYPGDLTSTHEVISKVNELVAYCLQLKQKIERLEFDKYLSTQMMKEGNCQCRN